ncbi:FG-GAP-like repeat-containing protein [Pedococcus sp. NPDC057267]|uniref:FG-GAP-like repeat-containing protein n=1 Tax=Pedococcus sp. NPDC057267 TaxID=3346077 RepID=UPI003642A311
MSAAVALAALAVTGSAVGAGPADAAGHPRAVPAATLPLFGSDVSWPQCPTSMGGQGLPMPAGPQQFLVVGLTFGLPFTENPCLADQVAWATANGVPAQGYTMAAFPTAAQLTAYRGSGPWSSTTRAGQLSNVGYAEASYPLATLNRVGFAPPVVWIDVEPRPRQPWPTSTAAQQRENRYVVEGLMRGLRDAGVAYGLYSYASGWAQVTGSWRLPGVPVWATAGTLDYLEEALDRCTQPSFSAGKVLLSQWYDAVRDQDRTCGTYAFTAFPVPASSLSGSTADFNGDWDNDVLARVRASGELRLYAGTGSGSLREGVRVGTGWQVFNALETVGDFTGDGALDVTARLTSTGELWLYRGNGTGGWLPRVRVGTAWDVFSSIVAPGDFNGDQRVDLLARERSTGYLWLYPGNGVGGFLPRVRVGSGWNGYSAILGPGDVNGDGVADLLAREASTGYLWLYPGDGRGGWLPRVRIGTGWNAMTALMSPGDLNGDRVPDVLARDATGNLWLYPRTAAGGWLPRVRVGTGWNGLDAIL